MSFVNWDDSWSVKVKRCDEEHKKLFALINDLHDAMKTGKGKQVLERVIHKLLDYTKYHFSAEEALLQRTNYGELVPHRLKHRELTQKVEHFEREMKAGAVGQSVQVTQYLKDWLVTHIQQTDQRYSTHLNANGVR